MSIAQAYKEKDGCWGRLAIAILKKLSKVYSMDPAQGQICAIEGLHEGEGSRSDERLLTSKTSLAHKTASWAESSKTLKKGRTL